MDNATIAQAKRGSREAQACLLRELQDPWYRLCLSLLRDADRAADATQETALRFLRQLPGFRGDSQLRTWSLGIAINVVREMRRAKRPMMELDEDSRGGMEDEALRLPGNVVEESERRENLHATLTGLPDRQREVVVLRYFEDLSTEQTAVAMNCAVGTVKATLHQALRSLREKMKEWV